MSSQLCVYRRSRLRGCFLGIKLEGDEEHGKEQKQFTLTVSVLLALIFLLPTWSYSQTPTVPSRMEFAGIKLKLTEDARKEIQKDVDALTRSPKYFNIKVERAKTYFPFIEKVFREQGLHEDFKYLVLQESALIPDAVSSSDAVGFWQFKDFTAMEVGLRVDNHVDERMNIVSSSRGAARYMKKNNLYFDNWLHALQAYQMGPGGAMRALGKGGKGAKSMVIDKNTYWYVKKFLAHKVAFGNAVNGDGQTKLVEYTDGKNKSLKEISQETGVSVQHLVDFNKWLKRGKIPDDKAYTVVLPVSEIDNIKLAALETGSKTEEKRILEYKFPESDIFPEIEEYEAAVKGSIVEINRLPGIIGKKGDEIPALARKGDIDLSKFLKYNDLVLKDKIIPGQVYYYKRKRSKAQTHFYVARPEDTWWSISQKFGIKLKKLKSKNRIRGDENLKAGRVLWLRYIRPERIDIKYNNIPKQEKEPVMVVNNNDEAIIASDKAQNIAPDVPEIIEDTISQKVEELQPEEEIPVVEETEVEYISEERAEETNIRKIHVVEQGETLYGISKLYNVKVSDLLEWNQLTVTEGISIGQQLVVFEKPEETETAELRDDDDKESYTYHTVSQGETLYNIARSYQVTIEQLMTWNDKEDFNISMGERIRIKRSGE